MKPRLLFLRNFMQIAIMPICVWDKEWYLVERNCYIHNRLMFIVDKKGTIVRKWFFWWWRQNKFLKRCWREKWEISFSSDDEFILFTYNQSKIMILDSAKFCILSIYRPIKNADSHEWVLAIIIAIMIW